MRVSPHVHALLLNCEIELASGARIPRFVPAYVIEAERLTVVDTAVRSSAPIIFDYIESIGRKPEEIEYVIHTHGHFDHVGGNGIFAERATPRFWAHPNDKAIIESLEYQERVRPVGRMREQNTSGDVTVTDLLHDGDTLDLGGGVRVDVFHTPGHSPGSVSLFIPWDGTLFCGDVLPEPGAIPIYEDVRQTLDSLTTLRGVSGATVLLSQLSDQVWTGDDVRRHIDDGEAYVRRVDRTIRQTADRIGKSALFEEVCRTVLRELGLPEAAGALPIYQTTVMAHRATEPLGELST
ncbi:MAG: MBL fold metallo-hydrolase [Acidobacteria bacterium]|nr:MBL fold metallo-hydrolase [Acidobacteriota bacterium]